MSWSYDVTALATSLKDQIRLRIGDTDESDPIMQDEEITFYVGDNEGWTRTVNKRSYEIYQKSSFNGFVNPVYTCNYAGRGTGDFAYSVLTLNLYDEDSLKKYASYKDTIISTNNLKLTLKKEYTKGNLKNQIESGGALLVQDYTICLYQDSTKPVTGKDPIDIIIIELYMYDVTNSRYFTEEQIYSLGPKAQKTITNQLFEGA